VVAIRVCDTGIGIEKDLQKLMFEAFAQVDGTTSRKHAGTGLGLSISRTIVELLGGEITVTSAPGEGSTFTVYLPLEASASGETAGRSAPSLPHDPDPLPALAARLAAAAHAGGSHDRQGSLPHVEAPFGPSVKERSDATRDAFYQGTAAGTTVLIVDDDFRNIFALTALLERGLMNVVAAESGADALSLLDERPEIAIVLMDIMMPVMDGYQAMAAIRRKAEFAELPIVAVTGKVVSGERERCIAAGASGYIPKPVDTAELLEALHQWIPVRAPAAVETT
jgi:CheY-like chemotaxis protein